MSSKFSVLHELEHASWATLAAIYGNAHPSIIGLLTKWWVDRDPGVNWVLDGAPSFAAGNRGRADAVFLDASGPAGVLEVEGSYYKETARKIGQYLSSPRKELRGIWFGILVLYTYVAEGQGPHRRFPEVEDPSVLTIAAGLTAKRRGIEIVVVTVDKRFEHGLSGIRATRDYYKGALSRVQGISFVDGSEKERAIYFREAGV